MCCKYDQYISQDCWHIIPALWLNSIAFSVIILKYRENSTYFSGSEGRRKLMINMYKNNKPPTLYKALGVEIVLAN